MSSVYDTRMVSRMRSPAARSARPVSVISTTASAMSGTLASVAPYESCDVGLDPVLLEVALRELRVLGVDDQARRQVGRPTGAVESAATASTTRIGPGGGLRVVQLGERDDVGVALLDPVAPGDPDVEHAVGDVAGDLLGPQDAHFVDPGVVDAAAVVDVGAADDREVGVLEQLHAWRVRASPWAGRGGASLAPFVGMRRGCGELPEQVDHLDRGDRGLLALVAAMPCTPDRRSGPGPGRGRRW